MNDLPHIEDRIKKLDELEKEVEKESVKEKGVYKDEPKYITEMKKSVAEQKKAAEKEKSIVTEHAALTEKNKESEEKIAANEKELKEASQSHEEFKKGMNSKYPKCYDPKKNTIDDSEWTKEDHEAYEASRAKRENLKKEVEKEKKALAEQQEKQEELKEEYKELVSANKKPGEDKTVGEPCIPCQADKVAKQDPVKHFLKFEFKDTDSKAVSDIGFKVELPDGNIATITSKHGKAELKNIEPGPCKVELKFAPGDNVGNVIMIQD